ncbi:DUF5681 domain-containing protein [Desulfurivibrio dismutans]|uniref:DUF5681 domain-containing protein n=1 Tax=Desulfurivibrio dismutans TaxID=1398908 RepID=UPI0023DAABDE|nr:DUF5681 domain-containing protein [Desulfurivibrio alkaliphilus]MDF1613657.1 DUF5681 domain-containing protein [Desulfurivibrio alkaliphilus]
MTDKAESETAPHLFKPGQSGNPKGRPKGSRNKATLAALELLEGELEGLTRKAVELALNGDIQALRLCIERLVPVAKEKAVKLRLPKITASRELSELTGAILEAVSIGDLMPGEAATLARVVSDHAKVLELTEIEARLTEIENRQEQGKCNR